jgi:tRNA-dihydrouridine synthase
MSAVPAKWDAVKRAVALRDASGSKTFIVGNGDVRDLADAQAKANETGCDGVMLGRAIYGNPWLYSRRTDTPSPIERMNALIEHIQLFEELLGTTSNFATMKKHFKAYISGWEGAKELRINLMETNSAADALKILNDALQLSR